MIPFDAYQFILLALAIWRESRGESYATKLCVAWSIRNRVQLPRWWGNTWETVVLKPYQYSSFDRDDPNATKLPSSADPSWQDSVKAATAVFTVAPGDVDPSLGATSYFDQSMDATPPSWAIDGSNVKTIDSGRLRFYKLV
jgi:N-acetylmuramoyl-L-alanine amidase